MARWWWWRLIFAFDDHIHVWFGWWWCWSVRLVVLVVCLVVWFLLVRYVWWRLTTLAGYGLHGAVWFSGGGSFCCVDSACWVDRFWSLMIV